MTDLGSVEPAQDAVTRDDRKSAALAARRVAPRAGTREVRGFDAIREVLRTPATMKQAGLGEEAIRDPNFPPVFFLDGDTHRRRRAAIARFFSAKAISTRHRAVMESTTDRLLADLRANGRARLDEMSFQLAVAVAAEIIGLSDSPMDGLARRVSAVMLATKLPDMNRVMRPVGTALTAGHVGHLFLRDIRPAIKSRRSNPREDVISHLVEEGYPDQAIMMECMTYAGAGMVTTREFIVMAAWHLFDNDPLRERFLAGTEADRFAILEELLRLEPVATMLYRRAEGDAELSSGVVPDGDVLALNLREANTDETIVGEYPLAIDPDRAAKAGIVSASLSFGDGTHRCPGAQVALTETLVFLDGLLRVPGIRLPDPPKMTWNEALQSYELRAAFVTCDRVS